MSLIKNILKDTVVPEEKEKYFSCPNEYCKANFCEHIGIWQGNNKARQYTLDHLEEAERRIIEEIKKCKPVYPPNSQAEELAMQNFEENIINHLTQNND